MCDFSSFSLLLNFSPLSLFPNYFLSHIFIHTESFRFSNLSRIRSFSRLECLRVRIDNGIRFYTGSNPLRFKFRSGVAL